MMMKLLKLVLFLTLIFASAEKALTQKEIFIKQVDFRLDHISDIDYENEYFVTLKFNKGTKYVFKVTNNIEEPAKYDGQAVVELMDADVLVLTNVLGDKYFVNTSFVCNKTGFYDLLVKIKDNKFGNSVVDVLMIQ